MGGGVGGRARRWWHDPLVRRAARATAVVPALAFVLDVSGASSGLLTFAVFSAFGQLGLLEFTGAPADRARSTW